MVRYWFQFEIKSTFELPAGLGLGCGVTAYDYDDAIKLLDEKVFSVIKRPPFSKTVENIDIRTLDQGHIVPNMKSPEYRGVWFPLGYD